ncbi:urea transporter 2 isoform X1 [Neodiprion pinetum]|uniref:urea transporter 2 isoform X1 n=2 Tax=Neodiprion pinetum TaxID=441929 RepID=UPI001EDCCBCC|nr:urea transporter 2-like isoform X1 [Neodiprion pinetum]
MSIRRRQEQQQWVAFVGDFSILRDFLSKKRYRSPWIVLKFLDVLFRGYGQVVSANNPISGLLIAGAFAFFIPGMMLIAICAGIIGLLLSMLIADEPRSQLENGLTVFNPILCGSLTYTFRPDIFDSFDSRLFSHLFFALIFSVYLARALGSGKLPCLSAPCNVVQLILIFTLASRDSNVLSLAETTTTEANGTSVPDLFFENYTQQSISNNTDDHVKWGMVFRGMLTSSGQAYAADNVPVSSIIYLAILTYSPITAAFSFTGATVGSLTGLALGVPIEEVYSGSWGYNALLTTGSLGGLFFVLNFQTTIAATFAGMFATILQSVLTPVFAKIGLPVLTVPFVLTTWLFLGIQGSESSGFIRPETISFPEKQRHDYISSQRTATPLSESDDSEDVDIIVEAKPS